jgi:hypothetical protein
LLVDILRACNRSQSTRKVEPSVASQRLYATWKTQGRHALERPTGRDQIKATATRYVQHPASPPEIRPIAIMETIMYPRSTSRSPLVVQSCSCSCSCPTIRLNKTTQTNTMRVERHDATRRDGTIQGFRSFHSRTQASKSRSQMHCIIEIMYHINVTWEKRKEGEEKERAR